MKQKKFVLLPPTCFNSHFNGYLSFFLSTFFKIILQATKAFSEAVKKSSIDVPVKVLDSAARAVRYSSAEN